jgi:hypothetical protein
MYLIIFLVVQAMGIHQDAITCYQHALQARPDHAMAYGEALHFSTIPSFMACIRVHFSFSPKYSIF